MKRFMCTKCGKVKRVRKLPTNVKNREMLDVTKRTGSCDFHITGRASK